MAANHTRLMKIDIENIVVVPGFNIRDMTTDEYKAGVIDLAHSIAKDGVKQPIQVTTESNLPEGKYALRAGHRRMDAVAYANEHLGAGIKRVDAIVRTNMSEEDKIVLMLADAASAKLTPLEVAEGINRLSKVVGLTNTEIAEKHGISVAYVGNMLELGNAPQAVKDAVKAGNISATEAVKTVKEHGEKAGEVITEAVNTAKASGKKKATAKHIKAVAPKGKKPGKKEPKDFVSMFMTAAKKAFKAYEADDDAALDTALDQMQFAYDLAYEQGHRGHG